ncbi:hypothetical protein ACP70R_020034 [Stipagrostis hirtigluma subsp. patula]
MAECYAPEGDDLHRRWLPREIFADIGIADADAVDGAPSEAAAAAAVEDLAVHLTGILGVGGGKGKASPRAPPPPPPAVAAPFHGAQACGLEGTVVVAYGGSNAAGAGAAVTWPFAPYSPVQWQVASSMVNVGGVVLDPRLAPHPCCFPPPAKRLGGGGGTGVFLPRVGAYRHAPPKAPAQAGESDKGVAGKESAMAEGDGAGAGGCCRSGVARLPGGGAAAGVEL